MDSVIFGPRTLALVLRASVAAGLVATPTSFSYLHPLAETGSMPERSASTSDTVADAALVVLAGQTGRSWDQWLVRDDNGRDVPADHGVARDHLKRAVKPVACEVTNDGERARLLCGPLTRDEQTSHARWVESFRRKEGFFELLSTHAGRVDWLRVLVKSPQGQTTLSGREFEALVSGYYFRGDVTFGLREPKPFEAQLGMHLIFESSKLEAYDGPVPPTSQ